MFPVKTDIQLDELTELSKNIMFTLKCEHTWNFNSFNVPRHIAYYYRRIKCEDCGIDKERIELVRVSDKLLCSECSEKEIHKIFAKIKSSEGQRMSQYKRR